MPSKLNGTKTPGWGGEADLYLEQRDRASGLVDSSNAARVVDDRRGIGRMSNGDEYMHLGEAHHTRIRDRRLSPPLTGSDGCPRMRRSGPWTNQRHRQQHGRLRFAELGTSTLSEGVVPAEGGTNERELGLPATRQLKGRRPRRLRVDYRRKRSRQCRMKEVLGQGW